MLNASRKRIVVPSSKTESARVRLMGKQYRKWGVRRVGLCSQDVGAWTDSDVEMVYSRSNSVPAKT
jgi:hypothetical protein